MTTRRANVGVPARGIVANFKNTRTNNTWSYPVLSVIPTGAGAYVGTGVAAPAVDRYTVVYDATGSKATDPAYGGDAASNVRMTLVFPAAGLAAGGGAYGAWNTPAPAGFDRAAAERAADVRMNGERPVG